MFPSNAFRRFALLSSGSWLLLACGAPDDAPQTDQASAGTAGTNPGAGGNGGGGSGGAQAAGGSSMAGTAGTSSGGAGSGGGGGASAGSSGSSSGGGMPSCAGTGNTTPGGGSGGAVGEWVNIGVDVTYSGCGAQTVLVDPVRPSDFYAFVCTEATIAVMKSTDFGQSFNKVNSTDFDGNPWGASIDPNPCRDPATPPTFWSPAGYGSLGAWKSSDGGVTWARSIAADTAFSTYNPYGSSATDLYHIQILPDDSPNHVLATYHYGFKDIDAGGFGESWDGGTSWVIHQPVSGMGTSHYVMAVSGTTWNVISQESGVWRTTTAGRVGGTEAQSFRDGTISVDAWTKVDDFSHIHGSFQAWNTGSAIYAAGDAGIKRSSDGGASWTSVFSNGPMTTVVGTGSYLYSDSFYDPAPRRATIADGTDWTTYTAEPSYAQAPAPMGAASSFDGEHWVMVTGNDDDGIWRYVEP